jgi:hypothetical protein
VSLGQNGCGSLDRRGNSALRHIDEGLSNEALPTLNIEEEKMNNEQKRHIWLRSPVKKATRSGNKEPLPHGHNPLSY